MLTRRTSLGRRSRPPPELLPADLARINDRVLNLAGELQPPDLRSLDAIHLATAVQFGTDLRHIVTYDDRMATAAEDLDLETVAPSSRRRSRPLSECRRPPSRVPHRAVRLLG